MEVVTFTGSFFLL